jgi:hypothetical protein
MNRGRVGEERGSKEADGFPLTAAMSACSMLIMLHINSFVDCVASACSCRPVSIFWSHLTFIVIELTTWVTLEEEE